MLTTVATRVNLGQKCKHVSGLAGLGEHVFITAYPRGGEWFPE